MSKPSQETSGAAPFAADRVVAIVSPQFPPSTLAGVHRARHMAKHLPDHGWRPIVVRVDERLYAERQDPALAALVPERLEQIRAGALPIGLARRFGVGDLGLRAYWQIGRALDGLVSERAPDAVFITGFPFYPMLLAPRLKRRFGVPIVLDFQDPWVSNFGAGASAWSKAGLAHRLAVALEPKALRAADYVTSVSDTQNAAMAARYPWLDAARMAAIPIGGDPEDFDALRGAADTSTQWLEPGLLNFVYVGTFLPRAGPLVREVFKALAEIKASQPELARRLRLTFIGTSNQTDGRANQIMPIAQQEGVAELTREIPQRLPFLDALSVLANADAILLIGSDEPHYTASKIYPALMSGRPYLSLFHRASSAHAILSAAGGGRSLAFDSAETLAALKPEIVETLVTLATSPDRYGQADPAAYAPYTARAVAGRFATIFDQLHAERASSRST
ncbi:MAG: hypothetical protein JWL79_3890 [Frankiales bacterium]|nr:hypothetical protein [Frankiales bacterium]